MFVSIVPGKVSPGPINNRGVERAFDGFWVERWRSFGTYDRLRTIVRNATHARPRTNAVSRTWHPFYADAVKTALRIHADSPSELSPLADL